MRITPALGVVLVGAAACPVTARVALAQTSAIAGTAASDAARHAPPESAPASPLAAAKSGGEPSDALQIPVTLNLRDMPLLTIADMLQHSSPAHFRYGAPPDLVLSANLANEPLLSGLGQMLQGTGWTFHRSDADVFLLPQWQSKGLAEQPSVWSWYSGTKPPPGWLAVPDKSLAVRLHEGIFNDGTEPKVVAESDAAAVYAVPAPPQPASAPVVNLEFGDVAVSDLADAIGTQGGIKILVGNDVVAHLKKVSLYNKTPEEAIRLITQYTGLAWQKIDDKTYAIANHSADFPLKDPVAMPRPGKPKLGGMFWVDATGKVANHLPDQPKPVDTFPKIWAACPVTRFRVARPGLQIVRQMFVTSSTAGIGAVMGGDGLKTMRFMRCQINLKFVPAGTRLLLETATPATFYVNGAPVLRNFSGMRSVDLTRTLHRGENMLALAFSAGDKPYSILNRETQPIFSYEWLFQPEQGVPAGVIADDIK